MGRSGARRGHVSGWRASPRAKWTGPAGLTSLVRRPRPRPLAMRWCRSWAVPSGDRRRGMSWSTALHYRAFRKVRPGARERLPGARRRRLATSPAPLLRRRQCWCGIATGAAIGAGAARTSCAWPRTFDRAPPILFPSARHEAWRAPLLHSLGARPDSPLSARPRLRSCEGLDCSNCVVACHRSAQAFGLGRGRCPRAEQIFWIGSVHRDHGFLTQIGGNRAHSVFPVLIV